jgi:hypothetical protein
MDGWNKPGNDGKDVEKELGRGITRGRARNVSIRLGRNAQERIRLFVDIGAGLASHLPGLLTGLSLLPSLLLPGLLTLLTLLTLPALLTLLALLHALLLAGLLLALLTRLLALLALLARPIRFIRHRNFLKGWVKEIAPPIQNGFLSESFLFAPQHCDRNNVMNQCVGNRLALAAREGSKKAWNQGSASALAYFVPLSATR